MVQKNTVKFLIGLLIFICTFIGLNNTMYSFRTKRFYVNYGFILWAIISMIIFGVIYIRIFYNEIVSKTFDLNSAVNLYYYMNVMAAFINYISQLRISKPSCDYFNTSKLFEVLEYFTIEAIINQSIIWMVFTKIIIFPLAIESTLILRHLRNEDNEKSLLWTIYTLYPLVMSNIVPNCFFGVMVVCRQAINALNSDLEKLLKEANLLQRAEQMHLHKNFYRMQKFCNMADKLDELSLIFNLICSQTISYMKLAEIPLLASLVCNLFGVTAGLFQQYYAVAGTFINDDEYDAFDALTNGVFLVISFLEIAMFSLVADQSISGVNY